MPEMPEIETIARKLRKVLIGKKIAEVRLSGKPLRKPVAETFAANLSGRTIQKIMRRGKYLVLELDPHGFWLMHLGMSGRVLYHASAGESAGHTHAVIRFTDSAELQYRDPRRFGLLAFYETLQPGGMTEIRSLGMDPLSSRFNRDWLWPLLRKSRREVKSFLLDQRRIAGLGNIYACEALFLARIHPARRCHTLTLDEAGRLAEGVKNALRLAIRNRGTSFSDFMDSDGKPGGNQANLKVFQREGKQCPCCGFPIHRIKQGNRSSFFCIRCQG